MGEIVDLLRRAAQEMLLDSASPSFQERTRTRDNGEDAVVFLRAWGRLLIEAALWIEAQQLAGILSGADILQIMDFHVDVARSYLAEKSAVPA